MGMVLILPLPIASDDYTTPQGRLYVSPSLPAGDGGLPIQQPQSEVPTTDYVGVNGTGADTRCFSSAA